MPVAAKMQRKKPRNSGNHDCVARTRCRVGGRVGGELPEVHSTARVKATIAANAPSVTFAPAERSASQPPNGRVAEPTRAPRKAKYAK